MIIQLHSASNKNYLPARRLPPERREENHHETDEEETPEHRPHGVRDRQEQDAELAEDAHEAEEPDAAHHPEGPGHPDKADIQAGGDKDQIGERTDHGQIDRRQVGAPDWRKTQKRTRKRERKPIIFCLLFCLWLKVRLTTSRLECQIGAR